LNSLVSPRAYRMQSHCALTTSAANAGKAASRGVAASGDHGCAFISASVSISGSFAFLSAVLLLRQRESRFALFRRVRDRACAQGLWPEGSAGPVVATSQTQAIGVTRRVRLVHSVNCRPSRVTASFSCSRRFRRAPSRWADAVNVSNATSSVALAFAGSVVSLG